MKFKLDENFGSHLFRGRGYDIATVRDEHLQGCTDQHLFEVCRAEHRCLVTLDRDFADVLRFSPDQAYGIAVIRVAHNPSLQLLEQLIGQFLRALEKTPIEGRLWIIELGRIRIHQSSEDEL